jgi:hypothetical protein
MKSYEQTALNILRGKVEEKVEQIDEYGAGRADPKQKEREESEKQMANFLAKGGKVQQGKPQKAPKARGRFVASGSLAGKERRRNAQGGKMFVRSEEFELEEASVHPMALHVKPVPGQSKNGQEVYKVHAVGPKVTGIKVGEHLNDTELDDATEAGHKIKMVEDTEYQDVEYDVDYTMIQHNSFLVELDESYSNFVKAANYFCESEEEAVQVANEFYNDRDHSLIIEMAAQESINSTYEDFINEGHEVTLPKYTVENNDIYAEYVVKDKETGVVTRFVHHGTTASVEDKKGEI